VRQLEPAVLLRIALVFRTGALTPAAQAFVGCVEDYVSGRGAAAGPGEP
jgi:hypothetical protein